ncbi:PseG/SpsG family protein [Chungangia koreensis]|uniref:PseG/SpsG family protein n=1 Tax=Chungangia koreensis TaxID=752657 RepID=A0ABV8X724_9LACT
MNRNSVPQQVGKKKVVFSCKYSATSGLYHAERSLAAADMLSEWDILFLIDESSKEIKNLIEGKGYKTRFVSGSSSFISVLREECPDLLVRDGDQTDLDEAKLVREIVSAIIHLDDFGTGGQEADLVLHSLYQENREPYPSHYVSGPDSYIVPEDFVAFKHQGKEKELSPVPHLVVYHGYEDPENLTYRTLRHILQLQIPLRVTILLGEGYKHSKDDIQMMALGRRNTTIVKPPYSLPEELAKADIVVCSAGYTPYEVAVIGLPCIVIAQNEQELQNAFPKEENGFIHLGLGRKVKQSLLLNAIMEMLLHDARRERAVKRQLALNLFNGKEKIAETILYYLDYPPRQSKDALQKVKNMLQ